jgi:hypothetical protein
MSATLFGATANLGPETVNADVIKSRLVGGKDPRTLDYWDDDDYDSVFDAFYPGNGSVGVPVKVNGIGTLTILKEWGETKDETDIGQVVRHEETGKEYLLTGTYSSWDGDHFDTCVEAERYTFTEERWRAI